MLANNSQEFLNSTCAHITHNNPISLSVLRFTSTIESYTISYTLYGEKWFKKNWQSGKSKGHLPTKWSRGASLTRPLKADYAPKNQTKGIKLDHLDPSSFGQL